MADDLVRPTLATRFRAWLRSFVLPYASEAVGAGGAGLAPDYPPLQAMSAMGAFPTVYACVSAIAEDLASLPIRVRVGTGAGADILDDHPLLDLLARPSRGMTERRWRQQLYVDEALTRTAYWWMDDQAGALRRLHPQHAKPRIDRWGDPLSWVYGDLEIPADQVYMVAGPSWSADRQMIFGESPIRPLHDDLVTIQKSKKHAATAAARGRPDILFSAPPESPLLSEAAMAAVIAKWEQATRIGQGAFFASGGLSATPMSWSLRDLEYAAVHSEHDKAVMIVLGVPAVRLGLPNANYGEAKVQMRAYWERLIARARGFDDELTRLARLLDARDGNDRRVYVEHDATNVEALQTSYDQRQVRAGNWVAIFGMDPQDAARVEGFEREAALIPTDGASGKVPRRPRQDVGEQQEQRRGLVGDLAAYLRQSAQRYQLLRQAEPSDAEWTMAAQAEAVRLAQVLELHEVERAAASAVARDVAAIQAEVARRAEDPQQSPAFGLARAASIARQVG